MHDTLRLDLPLLLPDITDASDACVGRLIDSLSKRAGVLHAHVVPATADAPASLCIHHDPARLSLPQIRKIVEAAGAELTGRYGHILWQMDGITHQRRARTVSDRLRNLSGVLEAGADAAGLVRIEYDRQQTDENAIRAVPHSMGVYERGITPTPPHGTHQHGHQHEAHDKPHDHAGKHGHAHHHHHHHSGLFGQHGELIFALLAGFCLATGFVISLTTPSASLSLPLGFYIAAYGFGGFHTVREAYDSLRLRRFEIDTLMLVAAAGAAALGAWAEGALLLFLFSLGHALEHHAMGKARHAIEALSDLMPQLANMRDEDGIKQVAIEDLRIGDVVVVRPGERVPADGFVLTGRSSINEAPITGESMPADKHSVPDALRARQRPGLLSRAHLAFAGTINGEGALDIEVTRLSGDNMLARVVHMVSEAETRKSPTQHFADRFERIFVPLVLALVGALLLSPLLTGEPFRDAFYRAMAVLVAASPCALAIATPSAVLSGVARAARGGVLVKGGRALEALGMVRTIAFDKTGTLTSGTPHIREIVPAPGITRDELLATAIAVESLSDHPLARAVAEDGLAMLGSTKIPEAENLRSLTGAGIAATVAGDMVWIGKAGLFGSDDVPALSPHMADVMADLQAKGLTVMAIRHGARELGAIGLADNPRTEAQPAIARLRKLGIKHMVMLSGDHQQVASQIGAEVGLDEAQGGLLPDDKVAAIRQLQGDGPVAMVGDGVNDAPAMASAAVGIAMGVAGSDMALETADVALMADDLGRLPFAVLLGRKTVSTIRQNLFLSLGMVAILVPATLFGLGIGPAVVLHEGSTLVVVANALRLLSFRDRGAARA